MLVLHSLHQCENAPVLAGYVLSNLSITHYLTIYVVIVSSVLIWSHENIDSLFDNRLEVWPSSREMADMSKALNLITTTISKHISKIESRGLILNIV